MTDAAQNALLLAPEGQAAGTILQALQDRGLRPLWVRDDASAGQQAARKKWDLIVVESADQRRMSPLLEAVQRTQPEVPLLLLGAKGAAAGQPLDRPSLEAMLDLMLPCHQVPVAAVTEADSRRHAIAGRSPQLLQTIAVARRVAPTSMPVLITGESGSGKELVAYLIHSESDRRDKPFVHVNCAALSESLLESELFGHERGAFTGAVSRREGRFERANGGTLLLDEISETTPKLQAELLRALEQQSFERVGGGETIRVDVRIISTSNRDLHKEVEAGRFRHDLFYRLSGIHLELPPLRQRPQDIPGLVWHFVHQHAAESRRHIQRLDESMMHLLRQHPWPGNIRQLRNVVRAAMILGEGPVLSLENCPSLREELTMHLPAAIGSTLHLDELERQAVLEALRRTERNQVKAAELLGISDRTLREKLRRYRQEEPAAAGELAP